MNDHYHQQINESILDLLTNIKIKKAFAELKKQMNSDSVAKRSIENLKQTYDQLTMDMAAFCEKYPNNQFCSDKKNKTEE